jgi:hypothetical protein
MLELADAIRDEMGQEASDNFTNTVRPALESLYTALESTRTALTSGVSTLTGEGNPEPMGMDNGMDDMDMDMDDGMDDMDMDAGDDLGLDEPEDDFGASDAATGGEEPADRAKRESIERKKISEISKKKAVDYINKAKPQKDAEKAKDRSFPGAVDGTGKKSSKTAQKRGKGIDTAVSKIVGNARVNAKESYDPTRLAMILSKKK